MIRRVLSLLTLTLALSAGVAQGQAQSTDLLPAGAVRLNPYTVALPTPGGYSLLQIDSNATLIFDGNAWQSLFGGKLSPVNVPVPTPESDPAGSPETPSATPTSSSTPTKPTPALSEPAQPVPTPTPATQARATPATPAPAIPAPATPTPAPATPIPTPTPTIPAPATPTPATSATPTPTSNSTSKADSSLPAQPATPAATVAPKRANPELARTYLSAAKLLEMRPSGNSVLLSLFAIKSVHIVSVSLDGQPWKLALGADQDLPSGALFTARNALPAGKGRIELRLRGDDGVEFIEKL